jgi:hypothetical protein
MYSLLTNYKEVIFMFQYKSYVPVIITPSKTDIYLSYILELTFRLTENTICVHYEDWCVNYVQQNSQHLL